MKKLVVLMTSLLLMSLTAHGTVAQDLESADGLQSAYGRIYSSGSSTSVAAASTAESSSTPMEAEMSFSGFEIIGMTFDSDENAAAFLEDMRADIQESVDSSDDSQEAEIKDLDIDKDGFFAVMNVENTGINAVAMFVDGNQVFLIDVTDPDRETATARVNGLTEFVADAEAEGDEVSFNEDGTSTGGVFDRMPKANDDLVGDLQLEDYELFRAQD